MDSMYFSPFVEFQSLFALLRAIPFYRMPFKHAFVSASLNPQKSASWTSYFGIQTASYLETTSFIALRIEKVSEKLIIGVPRTMLLIISPKKPTGIFEDFFCSVSHDSTAPSTRDRQVEVAPPLRDDGKPLYLHTIPRLKGPFFEKDDNKWPSAHQLSEDDLLKVISASLEDYKHFSERMETLKRSRAGSGGEERPSMEWETWSGRSQIEYLNRTSALDFDVDDGAIPLHAFDSVPRIHHDLLLYFQSVLSFSMQANTNR